MFNHQGNFGRSNAHPKSITELAQSSVGIFHEEFSESSQHVWRQAGVLPAPKRVARHECDERGETRRQIQPRRSNYPRFKKPWQSLKKPGFFLSKKLLPSFTFNASLCFLQLWQSFKHLWPKFQTIFHDISLIRGRWLE